MFMKHTRAGNRLYTKARPPAVGAWRYGAVTSGLRGQNGSKRDSRTEPRKNLGAAREDKGREPSWVVPFFRPFGVSPPPPSRGRHSCTGMTFLSAEELFSSANGHFVVLSFTKSKAGVGRTDPIGWSAGVPKGEMCKTNPIRGILKCEV